MDKEEEHNNNIKPISPRLEVGTRCFYDMDTNYLYYVDVPLGDVYRYDFAKNKTTKARTGSEPIGFMFPIKGDDKKFIAALGLKLVLLKWNGDCFITSNLYTIAEADGPGRFNGGKVDPYGRLWAGTMGPDLPEGGVQPKKGSLYSLDKGVLKKHVSNIGISNGLAWNVKINKMYYIDTLEPYVFQFDYNYVSGDIRNRKVCFEFKKHNIKGAPDGLTIDADGMLYVCAIWGYDVVKFDPNNGAVLKKFTFPAAQVTAATWGGRYLDKLYVTTAMMIENCQKPPDPAGRTFELTNVGAKGTPDYRYVHSKRRNSTNGNGNGKRKSV